MRFLIVYDISEDKIRNKVSKILKQYGIRVQYSAFEIEISRTELKSLLEEIEVMIDPETDSVFAFELSKNTQKKTIKIGEKEEFWYVL